MNNLLKHLLMIGGTALMLSGCSTTSDIVVPDTMPRVREYRSIVYQVDRLMYSEYHVIVNLSIDVAGNVVRAGMPDGTGIAGLDDSILTAVRSWKFYPAEVRGKPIPLQIAQQITIRFEPPLEYTLAEIIVPSITLADSIKNELERGTEFEFLARQYSTSRSASNGGLLGEVELTNFPPDIYFAVRKLTPGSVSGPLVIDHSYAIYKRIN